MQPTHCSGALKATGRRAKKNEPTVVDRRYNQGRSSIGTTFFPTGSPMYSLNGR